VQENTFNFSENYVAIFWIYCAPTRLLLVSLSSVAMYSDCDMPIEEPLA